ncbi:MFS transporter [Candidatus Collinsella stercoripullorum]|uniref:MFS transporter n=1 Tax=Candidatus Collinsella stercoripullorum TaxID=2838522 RepID=UPI0022E37F09|nr:MFS transporter [Candidatus Collinsella stercoripullorum]
MAANAADRSISGTAGGAPEPRVRRGPVLIVILAMTFMEILDGTIVNVALPSMQRELGVDMASIQWVTSIYAVVTCAALLVFGRLGDMFGKVRIFQVGVVLFTAGSALCGLSPTFEVLVVARAIQSLGGAASLANNQGIITETFPDGRGRALGLVATFTALGAMCGPTLGGIIVSALPWEFIFLINIPVGVVSFLVGLKVLRNRAPERRPAFDALGAALLVPSILLVFFAITLMERGVTPANAGMLAAGAALLVAFIAVENHATSPLVTLGVFRDVRFCIDLVNMALVFLAMSAFTFIFPYYLQEARGIDAGLSGLIMACYPLVNSICGPISGAVSDKVGCERPTLVGQAIYTCGLAVLGCLALDTPIAVVIPCMMFTSLGSSIFQAPNNSLIMGHAPAGALGFVGSLGNLMRYLGQSLGITVGTALLYGGMSSSIGYPVTSYVEGRPDVFMDGMHTAFRALAVIVGVSVVLALVREVLNHRERARRDAGALGAGPAE